MLQPIVHGVLLALGLILPLEHRMFLYLIKELIKKKFTKVSPVIITAGLCDTFLITIAVLGVSLILMSLPTLYISYIYYRPYVLLYMAWSLWNENLII